MALLLLLASLLCLSNCLAAPKVKDDVAKEDYRLPQVFKTTSYALELTVPEKAFTSDGNEYTGTVTIKFSFTKADTKSIKLHAHPDYITIKRVNFNNIDLNAEDYSIDDVTQILNVNLVNSVTTSRDYDLIIEFTGRLSTEDMYGFYKSSYVDKDKKTKYLATTQFEPTHARKAFPCFDEPNYKAKFDVSIIHPSDLNVLFNTNEKKSTPDKATG